MPFLSVGNDAVEIKDLNEFKNIQNNFAVDLSGAETGVYFLNFKTATQSVTKKIIKN
jgi:hypothetical protein